MRSPSVSIGRKGGSVSPPHISVKARRTIHSGMTIGCFIRHCRPRWRCPEMCQPGRKCVCHTRLCLSQLLGLIQPACLTLVSNLKPSPRLGSLP
ncbi:hypothetical protein LZ32DRAFT_79696 [Colletotrichum eremochloae]|nr:hypothetical protein LZ32DRAFT_79696 [Colletotrichum eremochloae]